MLICQFYSTNTLLYLTTMINDWLRSITLQFEAAGIETARLDALVLLEDATGRDRAWLLAHPEYELDAKIATKLQKLIKRRITHEPLAYIRGKTEFYGREFEVNHDVLVPRPETEDMIDLLHSVVDDRPETIDEELQVVDVGTGSGCLAITAKLEFSAAKVYGTDISNAALKVAQQNAQKLGATVTFYSANLLQPVVTKKKLRMTDQPPFARLENRNAKLVLLCNLPYVPDNYEINQAATHEPKLALFAGADGLDLYRELFAYINQQAPVNTNIHNIKPSYVLTEALTFQHAELSDIAQKSGYWLEETRGLAQLFRLA